MREYEIMVVNVVDTCNSVEMEHPIASYVAGTKAPKLLWNIKRRELILSDSEKIAEFAWVERPTLGKGRWQINGESVPESMFWQAKGEVDSVIMENCRLIAETMTSPKDCVKIVAGIYRCRRDVREDIEYIVEMSLEEA